MLADLASASMEWQQIRAENVNSVLRPGQRYDPHPVLYVPDSKTYPCLETLLMPLCWNFPRWAPEYVIWVYDGQIIRESEQGLGMDMTRVPLSQGGEITATRDLYEVFAVTSSPVDDPQGDSRKGHSSWREI